MPTTNPVPSQDPSDLLFNAGKLDEVLNGTGNSFTDRLGVARRTVAGMNADFDAQLADAESDLNIYRADAAASAAEALGYLQTIRATSYGAYAEDPATDPLGNPPTVGDEYFNTTSNLLKRWNGTTWQASDINTANLAAPSGSSLVGYDGGTVQDVLDNAKPLQSYTALRAYTGRATAVRITTPGIAGFFIRLSVGDPEYSAADDGGVIIVDGSSRRWKRIFTGDVDVSWFGAVQDTLGTMAVANTAAIQSAVNYASANSKAAFLPAFYVVRKIKLPSKTHLRAIDYQQSGLKLAAGSNSNLLENENLVTGNIGIFVDNLTLDFNYSAQSIPAGNNDIGNAAFFQNSASVFVSKCYTKNSWQAGVHFLGCSDSRVVDSIATETAKDTSLGLAAFYCENSDRVLFDRNNVFSAAGSAIGSVGGKDVVCTNNIARSVGATAFTINSLRGRVQNNTVDTTTFANGITCGHGVDVSGTVISGNVVRGAANAGIALSSGANVTISANFIELCGGTSIAFASGSFENISITGNAINANGKVAIGAGNGVSLLGITATGNIIENCSRVTYSENTDGFIFASNIIKECSTNGVYFTGSVKRISVTDNIFENASVTAISPVVLIGATHSTISRNKIKNLTSAFTLQVHHTNKISDNQLDDDGVNEVATVTSLPTASVSWRGRYVRMLGENVGANQADRLYTCKKLGDGSYAWSQID